MSGQLAKLYLRSVEDANRWLNGGRPLGPETFLAFSSGEIKVERNISTPMFRVRIGGRLETANVAFCETQRLLLRSAIPLCGLRTLATRPYGSRIAPIVVNLRGQTRQLVRPQSHYQRGERGALGSVSQLASKHRDTEFLKFRDVTY